MLPSSTAHTPSITATIALATALLSSPAHAESDAHAYVLTARLDPDAHVVEGEARITWSNDASTPAEELFLHLYLNAFESNDTVFMRGSGGALRGIEASDETMGRIDLHTLATEDGADLLAGADREIVPGDHTQLRVPLPHAVAPGETLALVATFTAHLPEVFARTGYHRSFHAVAQWFPKLARREPDGRWATFPYYPMGEFYADFARYELTVDTPDGFVVGATGELVEESRVAGRTRRRFVAERVHDAMFCAWDRFEEQSFEAEGVRVRILHPEGYEGAVRVHRDTVVRALARYRALYGDYAYRYLTVVVPPRGAEGAAGMEYPTLFLTAGPWFDAGPFSVLAHEEVTAHELAHQWFQGMIASDEVRWPMLDEGLTQWATLDYLRHAHGERASFVAWPRPLSFFELLRLYDFRAGTTTPPPGLPAHAYGAEDYGRSVYARTALVVETIARTFGREKLERALGAYAREQRFRHPTPDDLFASFDRTYHRGFAASVLSPALLEGATAETRLASFRSRQRGDHFITDVEISRAGRLSLPTSIELTDEHGGRARVRFPAGERRLALTHQSDSRIVRARLDPDRKVLLDPERLDDARGDPEGHGVLPLLLAEVQHLLLTVGP
jgi:hypothetical protein